MKWEEERKTGWKEVFFVKEEKNNSLMKSYTPLNGGIIASKAKERSKFL